MTDDSTIKTTTRIESERRHSSLVQPTDRAPAPRRGRNLLNTIESFFVYSTFCISSSVNLPAPPLRAKSALRSLSMWSLVMSTLDGSMPALMVWPVEETREERERDASG